VAETSEFAPGIPAGRVVKPLPRFQEPKTWEFGIHRHQAERAGTHFDLRLGDPETGRAHSWSLRHLPKPGEMRLAVRQPTHTLPYMDFKGRIAAGYGKGDVELARRDRAEVLRAGEDEVRFNVYPGREAEEYALRRRKGDSWLLQNVTTTRKVGPAQLLPSSKPAYKTVKQEKLRTDDPDTELQAKIDGAHVLYQFKKPGQTPRVFSYRPAERVTGLTEHTHKLPGFHARQTPSGLRDTIVRGELYAVDRAGRALPAARVGGLLNAGVWKSREKQEAEGELKPMAFDIVRYRGRDVENEPYSVKKKLLDSIRKLAPWLGKPRTATTPEEKLKLVYDIMEGLEPSTEEGVIEWHKDRPVPAKSKFLEERDVFVRNIFPEAGTKRRGTMAGGFEYSTSPKGPIVGRVGTGFSHAMKRDMLEQPSKYEGLKARVMTQRAPEHYAHRAPAFHSFHLEQDLPESVKAAQAPVGRYKGQPASPDTVKKVVDFQGIKIRIDRPRGFVMMGKDDKGTPWSRRYRYDYGFLPKTKGGDGEGLDVFIGPEKKAPEAYWAIQVKKDGSFDEYKIFLGFPDRDAALSAYRAHIPRKLMKGMVTMRIEMMKAMLNIDSNGLIKKTASISQFVGFQDELGEIARHAFL
jgi:hypothetical protein